MKKIIALILVNALILSQTATAGGISTESLNEMFTSMGANAQVNITKNGAYSGQTANYYTGGSASIRVPNKIYRLASFQQPSIKAGCNGIDIYGGSFSFINGNEFIDAVKNIGSSALGYAFMLALNTVTPMIKGTLDQIKGEMDRFTQFSKSSCDMAKGLVDGAISLMPSKKCEDQQILDGKDAAQAKAYCQSQAGINEAAKKAKDDPSASTYFTGGNVMWQLLVKAGVPADDRNFIINVTGTDVVTIQDGKASSYQIFSPSIYKPDVFFTTEPVQGYFVCDSKGENCATNTGAGAVVGDLGVVIGSRLDTYVTWIQSNNYQDTQKQDIASFLDATTLPIFKLLVQVALNDKASPLIHQYKNVIAQEYLRSLLAKTEVQINQAIAQGSAYPDVQVKEFLAGARDNLQKFNAQIAGSIAKSYQQLASVKAVTDQIESFNRQLHKAVALANFKK